MSVQLQITLTDEAREVLARMSALPARLPLVLAREMDRLNEGLTIPHIQKVYLSFPKDGPSTPEGLRVQSNQLRASIHATKATASGNTVISGIGSAVKYARLHEFGGVITHPARAGQVRLRTNAGGELLRQPGRAGAIFAKASHKRVKTVEYQGKSYSVSYPARAPIQRGINDCLPAYSAAFSAAIINAANGGES